MEMCLQHGHLGLQERERSLSLRPNVSYMGSTHVHGEHSVVSLETAWWAKGQGDSPSTPVFSDMHGQREEKWHGEEAGAQVQDG